MPYLIIKLFLQIALRLFFRKIHRNGLSAIDNGKPALIIANHTASFLDAWVAGTFVKRKIYFFTRGDVFEHPIANRLLRSVCLLPVYRINEGKDKLQYNDVSNEEAMKILADGGAVMIFAEGMSDVAKMLLPLKKGPFRLAAHSVENGLNPVLITAGINYITPAEALGDVYINVVSGIPARDFFENDVAGAKAATDMMRHTNSVLQPLVWHADSPDKALDADELLLLAQNHFDALSFSQTQKIVVALNNDELLNNTINSYRKQKEELGIKKPLFSRQVSFVDWIGLVLLAPIVIPGYLFNFLPIKTARAVADKKVRSPDFYAPVLLAVAIVFTLIWYILSGIIGLFLVKWYIVPLALIAFAISAVIYLKAYIIWLDRAAASIRRARLRKNIPEAWGQLCETHKQLLNAVSNCINPTK